MVRSYLHKIQVHSVQRLYADIFVTFDFTDHTGDSDRIETVLCHFFPFQIFFCNDDDDLLSYCNMISGLFFEFFRLKIKICIRHH